MGIQDTLLKRWIVVLFVLGVMQVGAQETDDLYFTSKDRAKAKKAKTERRIDSPFVTKEQLKVEDPSASVDQELIDYYREQAAKLRESYGLDPDEIDSLDEVVLTDEFNSQGFTINQQNAHFSQPENYWEEADDFNDPIYYGNNYIYNNPYDPWTYQNNPWWQNQFAFGFNPFWNNWYRPFNSWYYDPWFGPTFGFNPWNNWYVGWNWGWNVCPPNYYYGQGVVVADGQTQSARRQRVNGPRVSRGGVPLGGGTSNRQQVATNRSSFSTPIDQLGRQRSINGRSGTPSVSDLEKGKSPLTNRQRQNTGSMLFRNSRNSKPQWSAPGKNQNRPKSNRIRVGSQGNRSNVTRPSGSNRTWGQPNRSNSSFNRPSRNNRTVTPSRSSGSNRGNRSGSSSRSSSNRSSNRKK